jgi:hypothetical protein
MTPADLENGVYNGILRQLQGEFVEKRVKEFDNLEVTDKEAYTNTDRIPNPKRRERRSASPSVGAPPAKQQVKETRETEFRRYPNPAIDESLYISPPHGEIIRAHHPRLVQRLTIKSPPKAPAKQQSKPEVQVVVPEVDDLIHDDLSDDHTAQKMSKESLFQDHPDLLEAFRKKPNSWDNLLGLLNERLRRERMASNNSTKNMLAVSKRQDRIKMAGEVAGIGTKQYLDLVEVVDNETEFYKLLKNTVMPTFLNRDNYNRKLREDFETKIGYAKGVRFVYQQDIGRFSLQISDDKIKQVNLSDQICYVLGYEDGKAIRSGDVARYSCDLRGGL